MKFKHMKLNEFNKKFNLDFKNIYSYDGDFFDALLDYIEESPNINYFTASFCSSDVLREIEEYLNDFEFILIEVNGIYIALY